MQMQQTSQARDDLFGCRREPLACEKMRLRCQVPDWVRQWFAEPRDDAGGCSDDAQVDTMRCSCWVLLVGVGDELSQCRRGPFPKAKMRVSR